MATTKGDRCGRDHSRVINVREPGEDSSGGLARLPTFLRSGNVDLVILCHRGNDMLRKQDEDRTISNLDQMNLLAKKAGADVILVGVPRLGLLLKTPPFYQNLAEKHRVPLDGKTLPRILASASLKSDHVHPNATGYRQLAEVIAALVTASVSTGNL